MLSASARDRAGEDGFVVTGKPRAKQGLKVNVLNVNGYRDIRQLRIS